MSALKQKVVLITGGGSGIGLAVARSFLQEGCRVAIMGRNEPKLRAAAVSLTGGANLITIAADVSQPDAMQQLVHYVIERFGRIDILVNNAGLNIKERKIRDLTPEGWQKLIRTNLDGAFYCIRAVLPGMLERRNGLIININSIAGRRALPLSGGGYAASKFGMRALGLCLGAEEESNGIRVSNIYPGEVNTPILEFRPQPLTAEQKQQILQPEDVAAAVLFVAKLPERATVPELVIKPVGAMYW